MNTQHVESYHNPTFINSLFIIHHFIDFLNYHEILLSITYGKSVEKKLRKNNNFFWCLKNTHGI